MRVVSSAGFILLLIISFSLPCFGSTLRKDKVSLVSSTVFEVVLLKPTNDSLTYEKELPLDLIPFKERNDKYLSIGSAFLVGKNLCLSAAHVFNFTYDSVYKKIYLRDSKGNILEIDKILGYSSHRDFIAFSIKGFSAKRYLRINRKPVINDTVYAVGNALGEGIVIRNGLFTSKTPEDDSGEWEWLRFSAAASPGNSGGPLLGSSGDVIGIVSMKSMNENLNFALPVSEAMDNVGKQGHIYQKYVFQLPNCPIQERRTMDYMIDLPLTVNQMKKILKKKYKTFSRSLLKDTYNKNKDKIFPRGSGSLELLHDNISSVFPSIIRQDADGRWDVYPPRNIKRVELSNQGYFRYGIVDVNNSVLLFMKKPKDVKLEKLLTDSRLFMDYILQGISMPRQIANVMTKITSLGKAAGSTTYQDRYGRKWLIRTWQLEFSDEKVIAFILPVPGGVVTVMQMGQTGFVTSDLYLDLKFMMDFMYLTYYGTFEDWREFLTLKKYIPKIFKTVKFSYSPGESMQFSTSRLDFQYTQKLQKISDQSDLSLRMGYFRDSAVGGKVSWDVLGLVCGESKDNNNYFTLFKELKPDEGMQDAYTAAWERIRNQKHPYNSKKYNEDDNSSIGSVHRIYSTSDDKEFDFIYTLEYKMEGDQKASRLKKKLKILNKVIIIKE